jgi:hypothetical protein
MNFTDDAMDPKPFPEEACGKCPQRRKPIAVVEETDFPGVRFEPVEQPPEDES